MKTADKIVNILKVNGPQTAKMLADMLQLTSMGVRQHLQALEQQQLVTVEDRIEGRGRPTRYWLLAEASQSLFADRHDELSVQLIESVKTVFGDSGMEQLIQHREQQQQQLYANAIAPHQGLAAQLEALAQQRTAEGYMATISQEDGVYFLLENHCPICSAASHCLNFCRSELQLFQTLLKPLASVERVEHILDGSRRCAYRITPHTATANEQ